MIRLVLLALALPLLLSGCACAVQTTGVVAGLTVSVVSGDPAPAMLSAVDLATCLRCWP